MRFIPVIFLLFSVLPLSGQHIVFSGSVRDSLNNPVEYANVLAVDSISGGITAFAVTDKEGSFKFVLPSPASYLLKVSYIGFSTFEQSFRTAGADMHNVIIRLKPSTSYLDEVRIVEEMPVTMSGDTLIYKAETFTNGRERKLEDVLEKLPGVEVDEDGGVKVQGKEVNKVLVDGKQFFEGDTKMATKNLPASAVDKVQVLRNYNEVGPMGGLNNDEQLALNITLKSDKKNIAFGDISAGGGPQERFLGHANLFYYTPELNINLIADFNNVGQQAFTVQDYYRFSGGLPDIGKSNGTEITLSRDDPGFPTANKSNANNLLTGLGALNYNYKPGKTWMHSGFVIGSSAEIDFGSLSRRTYLNEEGGTEELLTTSTSTKNSSALIKYAATNVPNSNTYLRYSLLGKISSQERLNDRNSLFADSFNRINECVTQTPASLRQRLEWYHTIDDRNVLSAEADFEYDEQDPEMTIESSDPLFAGTFSENDTSNMYFQRSFTRTRRSAGAINYYRILNKTNHINLTGGYLWSDQGFNNQISNSESSFTPMQFWSAFSFTDLYVGITYKMKAGPVIISPSVFLHSYSREIEREETRSKETPVMMLPGIFAKWSLSSVQQLIFRYNLNAEFRDIRDLSDIPLIRNYISVFQGNPLLKNGKTHALNLYYSYFNLFGGMNIFGILDYRRKAGEPVNDFDYSGRTQVIGIANSDEINQSLAAQFRISKKFSKFSAELSANVNGMETYTRIEQGTSRNVSKNYSAAGSATTTLFKNLEITAGYTFRRNQYRGTSVSNQYNSHSPDFKANLTLLKNLTFITDYTFTSYMGPTGAISRYSLWDASLRYAQKESPLEFTLSAWNLLDTRGIRQDSFTDALISTYEYYIQPRYVLLSVKYDL